MRRNRLENAALLALASTLLWLSPFLPRTRAVLIKLLRAVGALERVSQTALELSRWSFSRRRPATLAVIIPVLRDFEPPKDVLFALSRLARSADKAWRIHLILCLSPPQKEETPKVEGRDQVVDALLKEFTLLFQAAQGMLGVYGIDVVAVKGRGGRGAAMATGLAQVEKMGGASICVFHHVDVVLPQQWDEVIESALLPTDEGRDKIPSPVIMTAFSFGVRRSPAKRGGRVARFESIASWANIRSNYLLMPYGDQTLAFTSRGLELLHAKDMLRRHELFEDFALSAAARDFALSHGAETRILPQTALCSTRRWRKYGKLRISVSNWILTFAYVWLGFKPSTLYSLYYGRGP